MPHARIPRKKNRNPRNSTEDRSPPVIQSIIIGLWAYRKALENHKNGAAHSHVTQQEMKTKGSGKMTVSLRS